MMENINSCDQSKLFENISKCMILSDKSNGYVCNRLIHYVYLYQLSTRNNLQRKVHHFVFFSFWGNIYQDFLIKEVHITLRLKKSGKSD